MRNFHTFSGAVSSAPAGDPCDRADAIFAAIDVNGDGELTEREFLTGCLADQELMDMLEQLFKALTAGFE